YRQSNKESSTKQTAGRTAAFSTYRPPRPACSNRTSPAAAAERSLLQKSYYQRSIEILGNPCLRSDANTRHSTCSAVRQSKNGPPPSRRYSMRATGETDLHFQWQGHKRAEWKAPCSRDGLQAL